MKRFIAALVGVFTIAALFTPEMASAAQDRVAIHMALRPLKIRTHTTVTTGATFKLDEAGIGYITSDTLSLKAAVTATAGSDTLEPINLTGIALMPTAQSPSAAADTLLTFGALLWGDAGASTIASGSLDSVYIRPQVSPDGINWIDVWDAQISGGYGASFIHYGTSVYKAGSFVFRGGAASTGNVWPLSVLGGGANNTRFFPWVRFIVGNDITAPTPGLQLRYWWSYSSAGSEFGH